MGQQAPNPSMVLNVWGPQRKTASELASERM
jgi:hypothetical protein